MTERPHIPERRRERAVAPWSRDEISGVALDPDAPLVWRRSLPMGAEFELRQGETVLGEMEPASHRDRDATAECLGRALDLSLTLSLIRGVQVETLPSLDGRRGPRFRGRLIGWGRIVTPDGEVLKWRQGLPFFNDHVLQDSEGRELLRLRPAFLRFARTETRLTIRRPGWERPDLPELVLLTWFLHLHVESRGRPVFRRSTRRRGGEPP